MRCSLYMALFRLAVCAYSRRRSSRTPFVSQRVVVNTGHAFRSGRANQVPTENVCALTETKKKRLQLAGGHFKRQRSTTTTVRKHNAHAKTFTIHLLLRGLRFSHGVHSLSHRTPAGSAVSRKHLCRQQPGISTHTNVSHILRALLSNHPK